MKSNRTIAVSRDYYTVNVAYSIKGKKRKEFHELMKRIEPDLYKRTQSRMTKPQAEALADLLRRWDIPVEVNQTADLSF